MAVENLADRRATFTQLLRRPKAAIIPGVYDALSATLVTGAGFPAVYIGSFAAGASAYGIPDVGLLTMTDMVEQARRVAAATKLPVLADAEGGFYAPANLWRAVEAYEQAGLAGIHIEDNLGGKHSDAPAGLSTLEAMVQKIRAAVDSRSDPNFTIIARSDALWVNHDLDGCVRRLQAYIDAGADAVFPTGITAAQLAQVRSRLKAPVMVLGDLPEAPGEDFPRSAISEFGDAGANIIVLYYFVLGAAAKGVRESLQALNRSGDIRGMAQLIESQHAFESRMGYDSYAARVSKYREGSNA
jgi:2-methylisocitrate lyase-like PEP mutase family enzyme